MNLVSPTLALAKRELRGAFSQHRLVVFLLLGIGATALLNALLLPDASQNLAEIAQQSRAVLAFESYALLLGLCLAVPSIAAVSITTERDQETLDQLRLTLLSDRSILRGKGIAAMAAAVAFIVGMMPIFAVGQFSVGLDNAQIVEVVIYVLLFTWMTVQIGIASSTIFRRALSALAATYGLLIALVLAPVYYAIVSSRYTRTGGYAYYPGGGSGTGPAAEWSQLLLTAPQQALETVFAGALPWWQFGLICVAPVLIGSVAIAFARRALARVAEPKAVRQTKLIGDEQLLLARRKSFPYYLIDPLKPRPAIPDGKNPMLVREFRWGLFRRATWMVRSAYVVFFGAFLAFGYGALSYTSAGVVSAFLFMVCMLALAIPATFGNTFTKERESGNFDMLRMTLLDVGEIIAGKAVGGAAVLVPAIVAVTLAGLMANAFSPEHYFTVFCGFVTLATSSAVMIALSLFASIMARRTSSAVTWGAGLSIFALFGAWPILYATHLVVHYLVDILTGVSGVDVPVPWWISPGLSPVYPFTMYFASNKVAAVGDFGVPDELGTWIYGQVFALAVSTVILGVSHQIVLRFRMRDR